jgi:hypothetical protein
MAVFGMVFEWQSDSKQVKRLPDMCRPRPTLNPDRLHATQSRMRPDVIMRKIASVR